MAIETTNARYEGFIFDGLNSRDFGVYVTDVKVFGAPTRDVEMISIPGRDGEFALDKGRFNNIQVVYTCALGTDTQTDFNTGVSDFRNWLASRKGYKRLEDEINTTEYRMAVFKDGLDVSTLNKETGTFEVTFDCKPQRFLKSGEIPRTIGGSVTNTETKNGAVVSLESDGGDAVTSLVAQIEPVQSGSGDPSPTNVRPITGHTAANVTVAGKNLIHADRADTTTGSIHFIKVDNGGVAVDGSTSNVNGWVLNNSTSVKNFQNGTYRAILTGYGQGFDKVDLQVYINGSARGTGKDMTFTVDDDTEKVYLRIRVSANANCNCVVYPMLIKDTETDTTYEPYTGNTITVSFGDAGTVYGGTVDVVTGVLTVTHGYYLLNGSENWTVAETASGYNNFRIYKSETFKSFNNGGNGISNMAVYARNYTDGQITFRSAIASDSTVLYFFVPKAMVADLSAWKTLLGTTNLQMTMELSTPITYQLTAQEVELLTGDNNVWADTGDISITYGRDPNKIVNPTLFDAKPILQVWGYGDISINGETISIDDTTIGNVKVSGDKNGSTSVSTFDVRIPLDTASLNSGDQIKIGDMRFSFKFEIPRSQSTWDNIDLLSTGTSGDIGTNSCVINEWRFTQISRVEPLIVITNGSSFNYLTAEQKTGRWTIFVFDEDNPQGLDVGYIDITAAYDGNSEIYISGSLVLSTASITPTSYETTYTVSAIYANSTKSVLGEPLYFDMDIGEAYKEEGGEIVSVNNAVSFPAELPVLIPGANAITFDNTIDKLEIVPRWWEV